MYVGDTQGDANACKEAEVPMIFASYGFGEVEGEYPSIRAFTELQNIDLTDYNQKNIAFYMQKYYNSLYYFVEKILEKQRYRL